jgi:hypothetical protein
MVRRRRNEGPTLGLYRQHEDVREEQVSELEQPIEREGSTHSLCGAFGDCVAAAAIVAAHY